MSAEEEVSRSLSEVKDVLRVTAADSGSSIHHNTRKTNDNNRNNNKNDNDKNNNNNNEEVCSFEFANIDEISPEFRYFQEIVTRSQTKITEKNEKDKKLNQNTKLDSTQKSDNNANVTNDCNKAILIAEVETETKIKIKKDNQINQIIDKIEILKLFKISVSKYKNENSYSTFSRIFTVLHINQLSFLLLNGWKALFFSLKTSDYKKNIFFSTNAALVKFFYGNER